MSFKLSFDEANKMFDRLREEYLIMAPKNFPKAGRYSDTDAVRYSEVNTVEEIVHDKRSDFAMKEAMTPITQAIFYFTEDEYRESKEKQKKILIFARPCDINAQKIQEQIYMGNGDHEDYFYKRIKERIKFVLLECATGFDECFCVSMGTNKTDNYSMAVRFLDNQILFKVQDDELSSYFDAGEKVDFEPEFPEKNLELSVTFPEIPNHEVLNKLKTHPMWDEYDKRCIHCGSCTVACSTCTCFTTSDIVYNDNANVGERRRVVASCMVPGYDEMAGGHGFRNKTSERYRFKILHKVYAYNERFGKGHMCVGCGRCSSRCPELIQFPATINKLAKAIEEITGGEKA